MQKYNLLPKIILLLKNKHLKLLMYMISIFVIVKIIVLTILTIKGVILYDFYYHSDYEYQKSIVTKNLYMHSLLLYTPIFISIIAIIKRKVGMLDFTVAFILSYFALKYNWFDIIHMTIEKTFIFDYIRQHGRTIINNQYTRIIIYILLIFILLIQLIIKKTRTLSRVMVFFMTTSCLLTVTVFHIAIPMGIFKEVLNEKSETQKYEIQNYSKEDICKRKNCYNLYESGKIEIISEFSRPKNLNQYERIINNGIYVINQDKQNVFSHYINVNAGFLFDYDIISMKKDGDKFFTIIDNVIMRKYSRESEIMFSFLAIMAHFVWIIGTMILLEFHEYKFKKHRQKNKNEEII